MDIASLERLIRPIEGYTVAGVTFRDITPLLADGPAFSAMVDALCGEFNDIDVVVGVEARGFIFGAPVAHRLGVGFVPVRKPGKLPWETVSQSYELEYGSDSLELHSDAIRPGQEVLIVDDVLATGGTAHATANLVRNSGGYVAGLSFVLELDGLGGRSKLPNERINSVLHF